MPYERMHHGAVRGEVEQKSERFPSAMRSALVCRYRTRLVMRAGGPVAAPSAKARGEPTGRGSCSDARVPADATARSFAGETSLSFGFPRFSPHSFLPRKPSPLLPSPTRLRNPHEGCWPLSSCAIFEASHSFLEVALAIRRAHLLLIPLPALAGHPLQSKATGSRRDAASVGAPAMSALLFSLPPIRYQSLQYSSRPSGINHCSTGSSAASCSPCSNAPSARRQGSTSSQRSLRSLTHPPSAQRLPEPQAALRVLRPFALVSSFCLGRLASLGLAPCAS